MTTQLNEAQAHFLSFFVQVLGQPLGWQENFFEAGADSVDVITLVERLEDECALYVPDNLVFEYETPMAIWQALEENAPLAPFQSPEHAQGDVPISASQYSFWPIYQDPDKTPAYNVPLVLELSGRVDLDKLKAVFRDIYLAHDVLHSVFRYQHNDVVMSAAVDPNWCVTEVEGSEDDFVEYISTEMAHIFDLFSGPLFRVQIVRSGSEKVLVQLNAPHIIMDGVAMNLLWREFIQRYENNYRPGPDQSDYFAYLATQKVEDNAFWQQYLSGYQPFALHSFAEPARDNAFNCQLALGNKLSSQLETMASEHKVSVFTAAIHVFAHTLAQYVGEQEVVISTPYANRTQRQTRATIGQFVAMLPLRFRTASQSIWQHVDEQDKAIKQAMACAEFDLAALSEQLGLASQGGIHPLQQAVFSWKSGLLEADDFAAVTVSRRNDSRAASKFPIALTMYKVGEQYQMDWEFDTQLLSKSTIQVLQSRFEQLVAQNGALSFIDQTAIPADPGVTVTLPEQFSQVVAQYGDKTAVRHELRSLSYIELDKHSSAIAAYLQAQGYGLGAPIAVALPHDLELIIAVLGIIKAGCVYVPLSLRNTPEQNLKMMRLAHCDMCFSALQDYTDITLASVSEIIAAGAVDYTDPLIAPTAAAYINFSSGTTGEPKGIVCPHQGITRMVLNPNYMSLSSDTIMLCTSSIAFDAFTFELWGGLLNGGTLVLKENGTLDTQGLRQLAAETQVNTALLTSALFNTLVDIDVGAFEGITQLLVGGDVVSAGHVASLYASNENIQVINAYGPTENTTMTSCFLIPRSVAAGSKLPIGRPLNGTQVVICDPQGQILPPGFTGEIVTTGAGLALGYLDNALNAGKFIELNIAGDTVRAYRTGDLGYFDAQHTLQFLGRRDQQVKVNGQRVELEAVNHCVAQLTGTHTVETLVIKANGTGFLVSFVSGQSVDMDEDELLSAVSAQLPPHLTPNSILGMDTLPVTSNGKVDKRALEQHYYAHTERQNAEPVSLTPAQSELADMWRAELGDVALHPRAHFFKLGGNSILALKVKNRIEQKLGHSIAFSRLLAAPLLMDMAKLLQASQPEQPRFNESMDEVNRGVALSAQQQGLWPIYQDPTLSPDYNIVFAIAVDGPLDTARLEQVLKDVYEQHDALHCRFVQDGEQVWFASHSTSQWCAQTIRVTPETQQEHITLECQRVFGLCTDPLFVAKILKQDTNTHTVLLNMPHIVSDGWSMNKLWADIVARYEGLDKPAPQSGFKAYLAQQVTPADNAVWRDVLQGYEPFSLHSVSVPQQTGQYVVHSTLSAQQTEALRKLAEQYECSVFCAALSVFGQSIAQYTGKDDVVISTPFANRLDAQFAEVVGFMVTMLPIRMRCGNLTRDQRFTQLKQDLTSLFDHTDVDINQLVSDLALAVTEGHNPLQEVVFSWQESLLSLDAFTDTTVSKQEVMLSRAKFPVSLTACQNGDETALRWEFDTTRISAQTIELLDELFKANLLETSHVKALDVSFDEPLKADLNRRFATVAAENANAIALRQGTQTLTYTQLDELSNNVCAHLQAAGVTTGTRVGITLAHGLEQAIALLGIVKAGAVYVPLDMSDPDERLVSLIELCEITHHIHAEQPIVHIIHNHPISALLEPSAQPVLVAQLDGPAPLYINFSSGTTGEPKGIECCHQGVLRLVDQPNFMRLDAATTMLCSAPLAFDAFTLEFWGPLLNGGQVSFRQAGQIDNAELSYQIQTLGVNTAWLTSALFNTLVDIDVSAFKGLKTLLVGGDVVSPAHVQRAYREHSELSIINGYGPTENTTFTCCFHIPRDWPQQASLPVGQPIQGGAVYVLNNRGMRLPDGCVGEIAAAGLGLATGYLDSAQNSGRFAYLEEQGTRTRIYKTGDLGFIDVQGDVHFMGRRDGQLKVNGFRVELDAIDRVLAEQRGVQQAQTIAYKQQTQQQLISFLVLDAETRCFDADEVARLVNEYKPDISTALPSYMLPNTILAIPALPVTANGKADRRALKRIYQQWLTTRTQTSHTGFSALQATVAQVWCDILGCVDVTLYDHFMQLGGTSLLALKVSHQLSQQLGFEVSFIDVMQNPVLQQLCDELAARKLTFNHTKEAIFKRNITAAQLDARQMQLWPLYVQKQAAHYNIPLCYDLKGSLNTRRLCSAFKYEYLHRQALHSVFEQRGDAICMVPRPQLDWQVELHQGTESDCVALLHREQHRVFDLSSDPLLTVHLIKLTDEHHVLLMNTPHIVTDGVSLDVLWQSVAESYNSGIGRSQSIDFYDYVDASTQGDLDQHYWQSRLAGYDPVTLHSFGRTNTSGPRRHRVTVSAEHTRLLKEAAQSHDVSLFSYTLQQWGQTVARYLGEQDLVISVPLANRQDAQWQSVVGYLASVVPVRLDTSLAAQPFYQSLLRDLDAPACDYRAILPELGLQMAGTSHPLQQLVFSWQSGLQLSAELDQLTTSRRDTSGVSTKFPLSVSVTEQDDTLVMHWEFDNHTLSLSTIEQLQHMFVAQLENAYCRELPKSVPQANYPDVITVFAKQVAQHPEAIALRAGTMSMTYQALWQQSSQVAHYLVAQQVRPGERVGICMAREHSLAPAIIGIVMAGGVYVPMSAEDPSERLSELATLAKISHCLVDLPREGAFTAHQISEVLAQTTAAQPLPERSGNDPIYINFSSGTTGKPKGIECVHQGVTRLVCAPDFMQLNTHTQMLCAAAQTFDAFTLEFWGPLLNGGCLHLLTEPKLNGALLNTYSETNGVCTAWLTAALFHTLVDIDPSVFKHLKQLLVGGDVVSPAHVQKVYAVNPQIDIINGYGPTENTTFTTCYRIPRDWPADEALPVGKAIQGTAVYVMDAHRQILPHGCVGEIVTSGYGLAKGYLEMALNQDKFITLSLPTGDGRAYRTGDFGYFDSEGLLRFVGRKDHQVKVNGYRIELDAIDRALQTLEPVESALTLAITQGNSQILVSFVVAPNLPVQPDGAAQLLHPLANLLPGYMQPGTLIQLPALPLTSSGKADRKRLTDIYAQWQANTQQSDRQMTPTECSVVSIWKEVLGVEQIVAQSHFYQLGGNSLLMLKVHAALSEQLEQDVPLTTLMQNLTVATLARALEALTSQAGAVYPESIDDFEEGAALRLTAQQESLYLAMAKHPDSAYNVPLFVPVDTTYSTAHILACVTALLDAYPSLRLCLSESANGVTQTALPSHEVALNHTRMSQQQWQEFRYTANSARIDLSQCVSDIQLVDVDNGTRWLCLNVHHIAIDGQSAAPLTNALSRVLQGESLHRDTGFMRQAKWQQSDDYQALLATQLHYWSDRLAGLPEFTGVSYLSTPDNARPAAYLDTTFSPELSTAVTRLAQQLEISEFTFWSAIVTYVLGRLNQTTYASVLTPAANRQFAEDRNSVGYFANTVLLYAHWDEQSSISSYLQNWQSQITDDLCHQAAPIDRVLAQRALQQAAPEGAPGVMFSFLAGGEPTFETGRNSEVKVDLGISIRKGTDSTHLTLEYRVNAYSAQMQRALADTISLVAEQFVSADTLTLGEVALYQGMMAGDTLAPDYVHNIADVILTRALMQPRSFALSCQAEHYTYQEVAEQAQSIAASLQHRGIVKGDRVAVLMGRHAGLPITLLGIWLAGGVYVPLDPDYPESRTEYILQDTQPKLVICDSKTQYQSEQFTLVEQSMLTSSTGQALRTLVRVTESDLSHLIYTSGSTGKPKGVMVRHGGVLALHQWAKAYYTPAELALVYGGTSVCFDLSVFEIFITWSLGGQLHFANNALQLLDDASELPITLLNTVPSVLKEVLKHQPLSDTVKVVNLAGEPLPPELATTLYEQQPKCRVVNLYGPSEDTTYSTYYQVPKEQSEPMLIGAPLTGTQAFVADQSGRLMPPLFSGELYLSGAGLARGYWDRTDLTAEKFVTLHGSLSYKTGDLVRDMGQGQYAYLGRIDNQVKLNGFRIELDEIDNVLLRCDGIVESCSIVVELPAGKQIVSFVVTNGMFMDLNLAYQRAGEYLPPYMVPAHIQLIDTMPKTLSGKQDRNALQQQAQTLESPVCEIDWSKYSATVKWCCELYRELLGSDVITPQSGFLACGGNSLLVVSVIKRINSEFEVEISFADVFAASTPEQLGAVIDGLGVEDNADDELILI
ncbi:non-ribosomal peptide synthetase [Pseudoalteromonas rubra]|uniref:non-ribosomal peptide synthetase n=1 Tax=Pseudoalteromonas rubra TaxID=43658 RepID=UPI002DBBBC61|nr:non-ribosomal peptide synthetase [Pseudoalteromonas rubra]MEC4091421.1 amino acid adenylation domain-containing protein [Pseudoalteromonas rubra]